MCTSRSLSVLGQAREIWTLKVLWVFLAALATSGVRNVRLSILPLGICKRANDYDLVVLCSLGEGGLAVLSGHQVSSSIL